MPDARPTWGQGWIFGLAILVIGVLIALSSLSDDDDGTSTAADTTAEGVAAEIAEPGDSDAPGPDPGDPEGGASKEVGGDVDEAACRFADRTTTLSLDGAFATTLARAGIEVSILAPATGSAAEGIRLPIVTSRRFTCGDYGAVIGHRGGLELDLGSSQVQLRRLRITSADGAVRAFGSSTSAAGVDAFTADLRVALEPNLDGVITLRRVPLVLTSAGARTLNRGLGTTAFGGGTPVGLLDIR